MCIQSTNNIIQRAIFLQESSFSNTQHVLNIGTIKHGSAQLDNFIRTRTNIENFLEPTRYGKTLTLCLNSGEQISTHWCLREQVRLEILFYHTVY